MLVRGSETVLGAFVTQGVSVLVALVLGAFVTQGVSVIGESVLGEFVLAGELVIGESVLGELVMGDSVPRPCARAGRGAPRASQGSSGSSD